MNTRSVSTVSVAVLFALTAAASAGPMSITNSKHIAPSQIRTEPVQYRYYGGYGYGGYGGWNSGAAIAGAALGLLSVGALAATVGSPYYGWGYGWNPYYGGGYGNSYYGGVTAIHPTAKGNSYGGRLRLPLLAPFVLRQAYGYYGGSYANSYPRYRYYGAYNQPSYRRYAYHGRQNYRQYGYRQNRQYAYRGGIYTGRSVGYRQTQRGHYR